MAHHREIVGDEQIGQPQLLLQVLQNIHHLRLHRDVQRRERLIAQHKFGTHGQRAGNTDALALPAAELMRKPLKVFLLKPHFVEQRFRPFALFFTAVAVDLHRLGHQLSHGHTGVKRGVRILKNRLHPLTQRLELFFAGMGNRLSGKVDLARGDIEKAQDGATEGGFPAAGLAHQAKRLAGLDIKAHAINRLHRRAFTQQTAVKRIVFAQIAHAY